MTTQEARAALIAAFPRRAICVDQQDWHYGEGGPDATYFHISVQPGWDGSKCSGAESRSLDEAVAAAVRFGLIEQQIDSLRKHAADLEQAGLHRDIGPVWTEIQRLKNELLAGETLREPASLAGARLVVDDL